MIKSTAEMDRAVERGPTKWRWVIGILAIGLLAALAYPPVRRWATSETSVDSSRVRIGKVTRGDLVREVAVQGQVVAAFSPTLSSPAAGTVRVRVRVGEVVTAGAALVEVESPQVRSLLQQEQSTLLSLRADLERQRVQAKQSRLRNEAASALRSVELEAARKALTRQRLLEVEGLVNKVQLEAAEDGVTVAEMRLVAARNQTGFDDERFGFETRDRQARVERQRLAVEEFERQVDELTLRAPVDGLVARVEATDRDTVAQSQALVTIVDLSAFEVEVPVPEAYADDARPGTPAVITYASRQWAGSVKSIAPQIEGNRVPAIVVFDGESPNGLKQNQRVSVRLVLNTYEDVLKVPRGPFLEAGGGRAVYVLADGVAVLRTVEIGALSVAEVEILSGLTVGERIIVSDTRRFEDAERVLVRD